MDPLSSVPRAWTLHTASVLAKAFPSFSADQSSASCSSDVESDTPDATSSSVHPPALHVFIRRLVRLTATSLPTFVLAHVYLTRLATAVTAAATRAGASSSCSYDAGHRVFLAALLLATKVAEDPPTLPSGSSVTSHDSTTSSTGAHSSMSAASPAILATICGVYTARDVLIMERSLLKALGHRLWVPAPRMAEFVGNLCDAQPELAIAGGADLLELLRG